MGTSNGLATFFVDDLPGKWGGAVNNAWGSSLFQHDKRMQNVTAGMLRLADFLKDYVYKRKGVDSTSRIFAKIDIEGAEFQVIPDLLRENLLCGIDKIAAEVHPWFSPGSSSKALFASITNHTKSTPGCKTVMINIDDESYRNDVRRLRR